MIIYEDRIVSVDLVDDAATKGHLAVRPQKAVTQLAELSAEESAHLFQVASYTAALLFQGLKAEGTNLILTEDGKQLALHVLARSADDGLSFQWEPRRVPEAELADVYERIKEHTFRLGKAKEEAPAQKEEAQEEAADEENYLVKHLIKNV